MRYRDVHAKVACAHVGFQLDNNPPWCACALQGIHVGARYMAFPPDILAISAMEALMPFQASSLAKPSGNLESVRRHLLCPDFATRFVSAFFFRSAKNMSLGIVIDSNPAIIIKKCVLK